MALPARPSAAFRLPARSRLGEGKAHRHVSCPQSFEDSREQYPAIVSNRVLSEESGDKRPFFESPGHQLIFSELLDRDSDRVTAHIKLICQFFFH
jgi:hypothetical protein